MLGAIDITVLPRAAHEDMVSNPNLTWSAGTLFRSLPPLSGFIQNVPQMNGLSDTSTFLSYGTDETSKHALWDPIPPPRNLTDASFRSFAVVCLPNKLKDSFILGLLPIFWFNLGFFYRLFTFILFFIAGRDMRIIDCEFLVLFDRIHPPNIQRKGSGSSARGYSWIVSSGAVTRKYCDAT